jgi:hypothetical protein
LDTITAEVPGADSRNFQIGFMRCVVNKTWDKCVRVKLGEIYNEKGEPGAVYGQFSATGLRSLLTDLEGAAHPVNLPAVNEIRNNTPYQWAVICQNGEHYQQFPADGSEWHAGMVDWSQVQEAWIVPQGSPDSLPWYGLIKGVGFVRREAGKEDELLDIPTVEGDFQWNYERKVTITFSSALGNTDVLPTHVVQCLGWQTGDPENPTIVEIGVEDDGSWQIFTLKNLE